MWMNLNWYMISSCPYIKAVAAVLLSVMVFAGCNRFIPETGIGYLALDISTDVSTKSAKTLPVGNYADFQIDMNSAEGSSHYDNLNDFILQSGEGYPVGDYSVAVYNCTEESAEEGKGRMRLYGDSQFEIENNVTTVVKLLCSVQNAKITVICDESITSLFSSIKAVLTIMDRTVEFYVVDSESSQTDHSEAEPVWFNVGEDGKAVLDFSIHAVRTDGTEVVLPTSSLPVRKAGWIKITLGSDRVGDIGFELTVDDTMIEEDSEETIDPYQ